MTIAICKNRFTDFHSPTKNNTVERVERFPSNGSQLPVGFVSVKTESFMYFTWTLSRTLCSPSNTWRRIDRPCALCQCRIIEIKVRAFVKCHHLILQINLQRQDNGRGILFLDFPSHLADARGTLERSTNLSSSSSRFRSKLQFDCLPSAALLVEETRTMGENESAVVKFKSRS